MGILHVGECLASGAEHRVYRQLGSDEVVKVPARWAKLWQTMNEGVARRDLDVLQCEGIDIIPTEVPWYAHASVPRRESVRSSICACSTFCSSTTGAS